MLCTLTPKQIYLHHDCHRGSVAKTPLEMPLKYLLLIFKAALNAPLKLILLHKQSTYKPDGHELAYWVMTQAF